MTRRIDYIQKYKIIYMRVCEYIASQGDIHVYKENIKPLLSNIIQKYYLRFRFNIIDDAERRCCDEYVKSLQVIAETIEDKVRTYEKSCERILADS